MKFLCWLFGCKLRSIGPRGMADRCYCIRCNKEVPALEWPSK